MRNMFISQWLWLLSYKIRLAPSLPLQLFQWFFPRVEISKMMDIYWSKNCMEWEGNYARYYQDGQVYFFPSQYKGDSSVRQGLAFNAGVHVHSE